MPRRLLHHMRANTIAYLALFVALGGTSYAATALPRNSVGTRQLRAGAVTAQKIRSGVLGSLRIAAWAEVNDVGEVTKSYPAKATVVGWRNDPQQSQNVGGVVYFHHAIAQDCFALAEGDSPIAAVGGGPGSAGAGLTPGSAKVASVEVFTTANNGLNVEVLCPRA